MRHLRTANITHLKWLNKPNTANQNQKQKDYENKTHKRKQ
jgi:hypothetical protein